MFCRAPTTVVRVCSRRRSFPRALGGSRGGAGGEAGATAGFLLLRRGMSVGVVGVGTDTNPRVR